MYYISSNCLTAFSGVLHSEVVSSRGLAVSSCRTMKFMKVSHDGRVRPVVLSLRRSFLSFPAPAAAWTVLGTARWPFSGAWKPPSVVKSVREPVGKNIRPLQSVLALCVCVTRFWLPYILINGRYPHVIKQQSLFSWSSYCMWSRIKRTNRTWKAGAVSSGLVKKKNPQASQFFFILIFCGFY